MKMRLVQIMELQQEKLTQKELAGMLRDLYGRVSQEDRGQVPEYIILFGIKYADHISSIADLMYESGIPKPNANRIWIGTQLAKYVRAI